MYYIIHVQSDIYIYIYLRRWPTWKAIISYKVWLKNIFNFEGSISPQTMELTLEGEAVSLFPSVVK